jgi:gentisate 1,2-dioxygenase
VHGALPLEQAGVSDVPTLSQTASLEGLYRRLQQVQMVAGWTRPTSSSEHGTAFRPHRWNYAEAKGALDVAGRLIGTELAERRNLILVNPSGGSTCATARTMMAAYQMLLPGESVRAHRHTPNALRLVLDAEPGAYTIVNGQKLPMLPGDVLLTPNWAWHGHANVGRGRAYWLDFLDVPLVELLDMKRFERHPGELENMAPRSGTSRMRFSWQETEIRLDRARLPKSRSQAIEVELGNRALDAMALFVTRLAPGIANVCSTAMANNIYAIVRGRGITVVGGEQLTWQRGDVMVVPARHEHAHRAIEDAVLFRVTDAPLMKLFLMPRAGSADVGPSPAALADRA